MKKSPTHPVMLRVIESSNQIYHLAVLTIILLLFTVAVKGQSNNSPSAAMLQKRQASQINKTNTVSKHHGLQGLPQLAAAFSVQQADASTNPLLQIIQSLVGPGITVSNVQTSLPTTSNIYGSFSGGLPIVGMERGLLMTSGSVFNALGPNISPSTSQVNGLPGYYPIDPNGFDAAVITFDVTSTTPFMSFKYVFASEEYNEYVGSQFNDDFAFLISGPGIPAGTNIATIPGSSTYVAINNVNLGLNSQYYIDNESVPNANPVRFQTLEYDGLTTVLTTSPITVVPGATYTITLVVQDVSDEVYDSGVFIEGGSITSDSCLIGLFAETVLDTCGAPQHTGSVELTVNGVFGTAQYLWSNGATTKDIEHLIPGTYTVLVTDSKGCTATLSSQVGLWCGDNTTLYLKVFIEGYYVEGCPVCEYEDSQMRPCLYNNEMALTIPELPFPQGPYAITDCDYVDISAMDATDGSLIETQTGLLQTNGSVNATFTTISASTSYYIRITHRNALEIWSSAPVDFSATSALAPYDFTSDMTQAYSVDGYATFPMHQMPDGPWALLSGDMGSILGTGIQDGNIDLYDFNYWDTDNAIFNFGYLVGDLNGDVNVDLYDFNFWDLNNAEFKFVQRPF